MGSNGKRLNYITEILVLDSMCNLLIAYVLKVLKMAIILFKLYFCALNNEICKLTHLLYKNR